MIEILIFVIFALWTVMTFNKIVYSKQYRNEAGQIVFYPYDNKTGYIANQEQIDKCIKSFKKCFFFNVASYKKDVVEIFKDSEVVRTPLPPNVFRKNFADNSSWLYLFTWLLIALSATFATYNYKPLFCLVLIMLIPQIQLVIQKIMNK